MGAVARADKKKSEITDVVNGHAVSDSINGPTLIMVHQESETIYSQGDPAASVMYIHEGNVKLSVVNDAGKEAIVAILGPGDFFGEGCVAGHSARIETATALIPTTVLVIKKETMMRMLHSECTLSCRFVSHLLSRNLRTEEDLIDQLLNSSEKRLARALLLLARLGKQDRLHELPPKVSQEVLAEMIGTTRTRVNFFLNRFRKMGFIGYEGSLRGLRVNPSLSNVVLHDSHGFKERNISCVA
jgi:CRP/FNR family transcriptional regulator, cyclic AMP receptor protein